MIALVALAAVIATPGATVANPSLPGDRTPETTVTAREIERARREAPDPLPLPSAIARDPARPLPPPPTAAPDLRLPPPQ